MTLWQKIWRAVLAAATAGLIGASLILALVQWSQVGRIRDTVDHVQPAPFAIVLGASVKNDGTASDALHDRVMTAVDLYKSGKVRKLLMSGDDGKFHADEVDSMQKLALSAGVTSTDILTDGHGYRTYESCKRAAQVFGIKQAVIVTQRFHLGRATYLCDAFGIDVQGLVADRQHYKDIFFFTVRDYAASVKAWWDVNIMPPASPVQF